MSPIKYLDEQNQQTGKPYEDYIASNMPSAEEEVLNDLNELCLADFKTKLSEREESIVSLMCGFGEGKEAMTIGEISGKMGISTSNVSWHYCNAIKKLAAAAGVPYRGKPRKKVQSNAVAVC